MVRREERLDFILPEHLTQHRSKPLNIPGRKRTEHGSDREPCEWRHDEKSSELAVP